MHLYSDNSKFAVGSALYKVWNSQPRLITYVSKRMPVADHTYSITKFEL